MQMPVLRLAAVVAIGAFFSGAAPQAQAAGYDGVWSVVVITEKGSCDRAYRYPVRIARGRVTHANAENSSFVISGHVGGGGAVRVSVSRGSQRADGAGRLSHNSGSGRWKAASGDCSGIWTAERRNRID